MAAYAIRDVLDSMLSYLKGSRRLLGTMTIEGPATYPFGILIRKMVATTINTAGAVTYTADQVLGGLILRDCNGAGRTDVLPTAALLVAAIGHCQKDDYFDVTIRNTSGAANTLTVNGGTNGTASGTQTIAQSNQKIFRIQITNATAGSEAYTFYSMGTVVF